MKLDKFRVTHFRNIHDSGWIDLAHTTALVGHNESGKTNLVTALSQLTAPSFEPVFTRVRDFPADRLRSEYADDLPVVETRWLLSQRERADLTAIMPEAATLPWVEVARCYAGPPRVHFPAAEDAQSVGERAKELGRRIEASLAAAAADQPPLEVALGRVTTSSAEPIEDEAAWLEEMKTAVENLDAAAKLTRTEVTDETREALDDLRELANPGAPDSADRTAGERFVIDRLPSFVFVDEVPDLDGQMDLRAFQQRIREGNLQEGDFEFGLLLQMAGIDDTVLEEILSGDSELRRQAVSQAGGAVTRKIRKLWRDRPLKVRFHLDGDQLNTLVCDPTDFSDIEVNLNQRSQGFRWFFSFFVILSASHDEDGGNALLLLDEPGLQLHPVGQRDLVQYLCELESPTVLTTQAPALQPSGPNAAVLAVSYEAEGGTRVAPAAAGFLRNVGPDAGPDVGPDALAAPAAAPQTAPAEAAASESADGDLTAPPVEADDDELVDALFQAATEETPDPEPLVVTHTLEAAAEQMIRGLVGDGPMILVENVSDLWYLRATSEHLVNDGRAGLPNDIVPVPAGGAAYLGILARLARQGNEHPIVVVGSRPPAEVEAALGELPKRAMHAYVHVGSAHEDTPSGRFEIEDLIDPTTYERFMRVAYGDELAGREPEFDASIPNQVARYESAMGALGVLFQRSRPAKFIANGSERNVGALLAGPTRPRFERLFERIREAFESMPEVDPPATPEDEAEAAPSAAAPAAGTVAAAAPAAAAAAAVSPEAPAPETIEASTPTSESSEAEADEPGESDAGADPATQDATSHGNSDAAADSASSEESEDDDGSGEDDLGDAETGTSEKSVDVEIDLNVDWD
ncbi:MAG: hypothetical protein QNK05_02525 [Myxococcota bacterium]|nr:hypothetical protein [Myxococcota bacterium]